MLLLLAFAGRYGVVRSVGLRRAPGSVHPMLQAELLSSCADPPDDAGCMEQYNSTSCQVIEYCYAKKNTRGRLQWRRPAMPVGSLCRQRLLLQLRCATADESERILHVLRLEQQACTRRSASCNAGQCLNDTSVGLARLERPITRGQQQLERRQKQLERVFIHQLPCAQLARQHHLLRRLHHPRFVQRHVPGHARGTDLRGTAGRGRRRRSGQSEQQRRWRASSVPRMPEL